MATQLITYSMQSGACLLLFYLFYRLLLRNEPSLWFNRLYLLFAPVAALLLPLLGRELSFAPATGLSPALQAIQLPEVVVTANAPSGTGFATIIVNTGVPEFILGLYAIVAVVLLGRLCLQLLLIRQMALDADALPCEADHVKVLQGEEEHPTFAFLNYIFLNHPEQLTKEERQQVLDHEVAHVQLRHTFDVLFYEVLVVLFWLNPAVWLLRAELLDVHEYQADAHTLQKHQPQQYSTLLAKSALYANGIFIGSNFNRHQVLRRLQMLQHVGEAGSVLRRVLVVPFLGLLVFLLSAQRLTAGMTTAVSDYTATVGGAYHTNAPEIQVRWHQEPTSGPKMNIFWLREDGKVPEATEQAPASSHSSVTHVAVASSPLPKDYIAVVRAAWPRQVNHPAPEKDVKAAEPAEEEEEKPYAFAEQMPSFIGGELAMFKYISQNLTYPEEAIQKRVEGLVFLSFVVQKDGRITDIHVLRGLGAGTDEEAIRVIQSMGGQWKPGMQNGRVVPVRYNIPIRFTLQ